MQLQFCRHINVKGGTMNLLPKGRLDTFSDGMFAFQDL